MKTPNLFVITFAAAAAVFFASCGIEEPLEYIRPEPKPYTSRLPDAYDDIILKKSTSANVLSDIKKHKIESISQSESVVACWGEKKGTHQFWLNMAAFDEEEFTVSRKYFLTVDEKPWHFHAEGQRLRFDTEMVLNETILTEPYSDENRKRIAILEKVLENLRNDITEVKQDSRVLNTGSMMINQTLERILYLLHQSPATAAKLSEQKGMPFEHLTLGKGRAGMTLNEDIAKVKIIIGRNAKKLNK